MAELNQDDSTEHRGPLINPTPVKLSRREGHDPEASRAAADAVLRIATDTRLISGLKGEITDRDVKIESHEKELADSLLDPVTKLPNRKAFEEDIASVFERAQKGDETVVALGLGDLAFLKAVNDTMSHPDGDMYLLEAAHALRDTVRPGDKVYRIGGDEFAVLYFGVHPKRGETMDELIAGLEKTTESRIDHVLDTNQTLNHIEFPMHMSVAFGVVNPNEQQDDFMRRVDGQLKVRHDGFKDELRATGAFPDFVDKRMQ